ncbi:hypothetical protein ACFYOV_28500 [Streptomyces sp. NPDC005931]
MVPLLHIQVAPYQDTPSGKALTVQLVQGRTVELGSTVGELQGPQPTS